MANKRVKKENKVENKKKDVEVKVWKILNVVLIMASVVFIIVYFARGGVENVWWNYQGKYTELEKSLIKDVRSMMTEYALTTACVYAGLQVYYYVLYYKVK